MDGAIQDREEAVERRFDPSRVPATDRMRALIDEVRHQLLSYEEHRRPRERRRRVEDQRRFDRMVSALVCDLVHSALVDPAQWKIISLSNSKLGRRGVGPEFMTEALRTVVDYMAKPEMEWLEIDKGVRTPFGRRMSTIRATAHLRRRIEAFEINFEDIGRDLTMLGDPIVLRSPKVKGKAEDLAVPPAEPADTYRAEMTKINEWLAGANIVCTGSTKAGEEHDAGDRWLKRVFNNASLEQGGRLYGGFWMKMNAEDRLRDIYINEEPVVGLDFGQCAVRIAYGRVGVEPPAGDLYRVPRLEPFREGVKRVLIAQFFSEKPLDRKPMGTAKLLPRYSSIYDIVELIVAHHRPLESLFRVGFGMAALFIESQILVRTLLTLVDRGHVALPVHDCLIVPRSSVAEATAVMRDSFKAVSGASGVVEKKTLNHSLPANRREDF